MTIVQHSLTVSYSTFEMFDLVNDVAAYPQFLPGCTNSQIKRVSDHQVEATLTLSGGGFSVNLATRNMFKRPDSIEMILLKGPFQSLKGQWTFTPVLEGSVIHLFLDFEYSNWLLRQIPQPILDEVASLLIHAFYTRAQGCYQKKLDLPVRSINVEVVFAQESCCVLRPVSVPDMGTVYDAIHYSGICEAFPQLDLTQRAIGIFGKIVTLETRVQAGDRVEIYSPLLMDPREARRRRVIS